MKKILLILLVAVLAVSVVSLGIGCKQETAEETTAEETVAEETVAEETTAEETTAEETAPPEPVTLKYAMWLPEPVPEIIDTINDAFEAQYPWITIEVEMLPDDGTYDSSIQTDMGLGTGPDIFWAKSFSPTRALNDAGYLVTLDETTVPLLGTFPAASLAAFSTDDGVAYAIPFGLSAHGIYYNKTIFDANGLTEPATWADLIAVCDALQAAGIQPFSNGILAPWVLDQIWFPTLGAAFYGGTDAEAAVAAGTMEITDQAFVDAFAAMKELQKYHTADFITLDYIEGINAFLAGQSAMIIDGAWIEPYILPAVEGTDVVIDWFGAPVVNAGDVPWFCLHTDNGLAVNINTANLEAAMLYINWCTTPEFAQLVYTNWPGTFCAIPGEFTLSSAIDQEIFNFSQASNITNRTFAGIFEVQDPVPGVLLEEAIIEMFNDELTAEQAAQHVQDGMATWYAPLMD